MASVERFDHYMDRCLYDPASGFYSSGGGVAGRRRGDFITSPEVGPLFADVLAKAIDCWWVELDRPATLRVYDVGTGPGTLSKGLARADGISAQARQVVGIDTALPEPNNALPDDLDGAIVLANELADNVPFRIVERRTETEWFELYVAGRADANGDTQLHEQWTQIDDPRSERPWFDLAVGNRAPLLDQARHWVTDVLARKPAKLVLFDYGAPTTAELAERGGWLRTYRHHERGDNPLIEPGHWDITVDVAIDQLPPPGHLSTQADFLSRWGIAELVTEGDAYWAAHAHAPNLDAIRMRSRSTECAALTDPAGLGSWFVGEWGERTSPEN